MSIRLRILLGCLCLTLVTVALGYYTKTSQERVGALATQIYDEAFLAVSYLRAAQNNMTAAVAGFRRQEAEAPITQMSADARAYTLASSLKEVLEDLEVARDRAMSPGGKSATDELQSRLLELTVRIDARNAPQIASELEALQPDFNVAVEIYAGDGFRFRKRVGKVVEETVQNAWTGIGISVAVALLITYLISGSIVPAVRDAVKVAVAIADGKLDNEVSPKGSHETAQLLRALSTMQRSISANLSRIDMLMREQAASHAGQLAVQNTRFESALNNMSQGLCMFDAEQRLIVSNGRFGQMFGAPELGASTEEVHGPRNLPRWSAAADGFPFLQELPDGRIISICRRSVPGGGWVATYEDVTEQRKVEQKLAHMAHHDALTGLANRVLFRQHLAQMVTDLSGSEGLAVLCLDLDNFKTVNDTLGHPVGDALLVHLAERLRACIGPSGKVARLGGDEFAILLPGQARAEEAGRWADKLIGTVGETCIVHGHQISVGLSIGVAVAFGNGHDPDHLLMNADMALNRAKTDGRGTYRFFEPEMDARLQARRALELDLRNALAAGEFEVYYQPLISLETNSVKGFEALVRWNHPTRGRVSPLDFIPLSEETGLIIPLGDWILRQACEEAATWPAEITVAVNLSPVQFKNKRLIESVVQALASSGLPAGRLEFEITESVLLDDNDANLALLHQLRALGVKIAMDDFGTGYSSLSYLRSFPFDKIKIDRSFVKGLPEEADSAAIIRAVSTLGQSLGVKTLAEGVETEEQLHQLRLHGCNEVQGYLFSPPMPVGEVAAYLKGGPYAKARAA